MSYSPQKIQETKNTGVVIHLVDDGDGTTASPYQVFNIFKITGKIKIYTAFFKITGVSSVPLTSPGNSSASMLAVTDGTNYAPIQQGSANSFRFAVSGAKVGNYLRTPLDIHYSALKLADDTTIASKSISTNLTFSESTFAIVEETPGVDTFISAIYRYTTSPAVADYHITVDANIMWDRIQGESGNLIPAS